MITRSQAKRETFVEKPQSEGVKLTMEGESSNEKKIVCPKFVPAGAIEIEDWMKFFEKRCLMKNLTDEEKLAIFPDFLNEEALSFYISTCMNVDEWSAVKQKIIVRFTKGQQFSFEQFIETKLSSFPDVTEYFNKKVEIGLKLDLAVKIIIQCLNHGLPTSYRAIMSSHEITSTSDWINLARRVITDVPRESPQNVSPNWRRPAVRPQYYSGHSSNFQRPPFRPRNNSNFFRAPTGPFNYRR